LQYNSNVADFSSLSAQCQSTNFTRRLQRVKTGMKANKESF